MRAGHETERLLRRWSNRRHERPGFPGSMHAVERLLPGSRESGAGRVAMTYRLPVPVLMLLVALVVVTGCRSGMSRVNPGVIQEQPGGTFLFGTCNSPECRAITMTENPQDRQAWRFEARPTTGTRIISGVLGLFNWGS